MFPANLPGQREAKGSNEPRNLSRRSRCLAATAQRSRRQPRDARLLALKQLGSIGISVARDSAQIRMHPSGCEAQSLQQSATVFARQQLSEMRNSCRRYM